MKHLFAVVTAMCVAMFAMTAFAGDKDHDEHAMKAPAPAAEMAILSQDVGQWKAMTKVWMAPDKPPMESEGTENVWPCCGGNWQISLYTAPGMQGSGIFGWDRAQNKYVGSWVDTHSKSISAMDGTYNAEARTLTFTSQGPDMAGKMTTWTMQQKWTDDNNKVFTVSMAGDNDTTVKVMEINYTRISSEPPRMAKAGEHRDHSEHHAKGHDHDGHKAKGMMKMAKPTGQGPVIIMTRGQGKVKIKAGDKVLVWRANGSTLSGTVSAVDKNAIELNEKTVVDVAEVKRVHKTN